MTVPAVGCGAFTSNGPSEVARGEYYSAGKPEFDQFFIELHRLQVELLQAPEEPQAARRSLALSLGLTAQASDNSLGERLSQEAKKLAARGVRLRLEIPEPSGELDASATLHSSDLSIAPLMRTTLPTEATRIVRSRNRLLSAAAELEKVRIAGINLEGRIAEVFRTDGPWKRDEVRKNLADGQKLVTVMLARGKDVQDFDTKLLTLLDARATTDPNLGRVPAALSVPPPPSPSEEAAPAASKKITRPLTKSGGAAARSPTPKPKVADGEASAPEPTQGTAPAEIEP